MVMEGKRPSQKSLALLTASLFAKAFISATFMHLKYNCSYIYTETRQAIMRTGSSWQSG